jgi:isoleucyl-tRNA synthetase
LTESLYQGLRPFIPEDPKVVDARSIHFLGLPDIKEEYFDVDIERQVTRMQAVIELTRVIRERHNLSLKVCLTLSIIYSLANEALSDTPEGAADLPL